MDSGIRLISANQRRRLIGVYLLLHGGGERDARAALDARSETLFGHALAACSPVEADQLEVDFAAAAWRAREGLTRERTTK